MGMCYQKKTMIGWRNVWNMKCRVLQVTVRSNMDSIQLVTNLLTDVTLFPITGLQLTLALTKPLIIFSHKTEETTYRTQMTGTRGGNSWQQLSQYVWTRLRTPADTHILGLSILQSICICTISYYPRKAMLARVLALVVCVCLSIVVIVSKWLNLQWHK